MVSLKEKKKKKVDIISTYSRKIKIDMVTY